MTSADTLRLVIEALDAAGIGHMLAGSFASSLHGMARTTADIDLVIDPTADSLDDFVGRLNTARFYVDPARARAAVADRNQFNVVDVTNGWKVDLIVRKDRPFSAAEFVRRAPAVVLGVETSVATAEDTVLAKLEWAQLGGSDRQVRDVIEILRIQGSTLDGAYLDRWAEDLGLSDRLAEARRAAATD